MAVKDKKEPNKYPNYKGGAPFDTAYASAEWYNKRVHGALDLEYFETPNDAFIRKMRCENTLGMFFEWSEREVSL